MNNAYRVAYPYLYGRKPNVKNTNKDNQVLRPDSADKDTVLVNKEPIIESAAQSAAQSSSSILEIKSVEEPIIDENSVETGLSLLQKRRGSGFKYKEASL